MSILKNLKKRLKLPSLELIKITRWRLFYYLTTLIVGVLIGYFIGRYFGFQQKIQYISDPKADIKRLTPLEQYQRNLILKEMQNNPSLVKPKRPETRLPSNPSNILNKDNSEVKVEVVDPSSE